MWLLNSVSSRLAYREPSPPPSGGATPIQKCAPAIEPLFHSTSGCDVAATGSIHSAMVKPADLPTSRSGEAGIRAASSTPSRLSPPPTSPEEKDGSPTGLAGL